MNTKHKKYYKCLQQRLIESHGLQCGFCTPGFVMSAFALQRNSPNPTREQIERAVEGRLKNNVF